MDEKNSFYVLQKENELIKMLFNSQNSQEDNFSERLTTFIQSMTLNFLQKEGKKAKMNKHLKSLEGERMFIVKARTALWSLQKR